MDQSTKQQKNKVIHTSNRKNSIYIRYEDPDGQRKVGGFKIGWYFAIKDKDHDKTFSLLNDNGFKYTTSLSLKFAGYIRIHMETTEDQDKYSAVLMLEKSGIETYEGDLPIDRRWYIDKEIEISQNLRKLYFDIETDDTIRTIEIGRDRIISYAAIDNEGKIYFECLESMTDKSEKQLLTKFLQMIKGYDLLLGWNSKGFDIPYLKARMRKFNLHKDWDLYCWNTIGNYDLLKRFRHIFRFDSHIKQFKLDYVSKHFLGKGKVEHEEPINVLYKKNKEKLKEYNIQDCILVKELDEKLNVSAMMIKQSSWCGIPPAQFGLYSMLDSYILKVAHGIGKYCRTSVRALEERNKDNVRGNENPDDVIDTGAKYTGALVLDPEVGYYKKVYSFDFKSLYPTMMRTSNIGFDSILYEDDGKCLINPGTENIVRMAGGIKKTFFQKEPSVINIALSEMMKKRKEYKNLKLQMIEDGTNKGPVWERVVSDEIIVKELSNSIYGIMGLEYGRYFSIDIAESITLFGQWVILFAKAFFEGRGYKVIYGDTDSVFVAAGKDLDQRAELDLFHAALEKELKEKYRIEESFIELEPDKTYETFLLVTKKTYAGHITNIEGKKTDDIYARGLEFAKKNTFSFAAEKQKYLLDVVLREEMNPDKMKDILHNIRDEFYSREFSLDDLVILQKIGKSTESYKSQPLHVRIAIRHEIKTGKKMSKDEEVEYIITKSQTGLDGIMAQDFDGTYDKDYYWENKTRPILERISNVLYPDTDFYSPQLNLFT